MINSQNKKLDPTAVARKILEIPNDKTEQNRSKILNLSERIEDLISGASLEDNLKEEEKEEFKEKCLRKLLYRIEELKTDYSNKNIRKILEFDIIRLDPYPVARKILEIPNGKTGENRSKISNLAEQIKKVISKGYIERNFEKKEGIYQEEEKEEFKEKCLRKLLDRREKLKDDYSNKNIRKILGFDIIRLDDPYPVARKILEIPQGKAAENNARIRNLSYQIKKVISKGYIERNFEKKEGIYQEEEKEEFKEKCLRKLLDRREKLKDDYSIENIGEILGFDIIALNTSLNPSGIARKILGVEKWKNPANKKDIENLSNRIEKVIDWCYKEENSEKEEDSSMVKKEFKEKCLRKLLYGIEELKTDYSIENIGEILGFDIIRLDGPYPVAAKILGVSSDSEKGENNSVNNLSKVIKTVIEESYVKENSKKKEEKEKFQAECLTILLDRIEELKTDNSIENIREILGFEKKNYTEYKKEGSQGLLSQSLNLLNTPFFIPVKEEPEQLGLEEKINKNNSIQVGMKEKIGRQYVSKVGSTCHENKVLMPWDIKKEREERDMKEKIANGLLDLLNINSVGSNQIK